MLGPDDVAPWRALLLARVQEEGLRARVWLVKSRVQPDAEQWVTVVIEANPPEALRVADLAMEAAAATDTRQWINTAKWEALGGPVPGYVKKFLKAHPETRLLNR